MTKVEAFEVICARVGPYLAKDLVDLVFSPELDIDEIYYRVYCDLRSSLFTPESAQTATVEFLALPQAVVPEA